jgi:hypothetical protein
MIRNKEQHMSNGYERPPEETVVDYQRRQEILFDISMFLGVRWAEMKADLSDGIMELLDGSRGLFDLVVSWTEEFDRDWEHSPHDPNRDYLESIGEFAMKKYNELVEEARIRMAKDKTEKARRTYHQRFKEHVNRIRSLHKLDRVLTPGQWDWVTEADNTIYLSRDVERANHLVHCAAMLLSKVIHDLHTRGFTYLTISATLGLSAGRTRVLAGQYAAAARLEAERKDTDSPSRMPWL